jgi:putative alpha-1,2-mannosidase
MFGQITRRVISQSINGLRNYTATAQAFREARIKPTNFQKKVLVWSNAYKNISEIPETVSVSKMRRSLDVFRGKVTLAFSAAGLVSMFVAVSFIESDRARTNAAK